MVKTGADGVPVLLRDVARVELGPEIRRGVSDLDGLGDHVGGIVVMRHGENALNVIERVKQKLHDVEPSLPAGVTGGHHLRPRRPHPARHPHAQARAPDRDAHRLAGDPALPVAHPLGGRADPHHSDLGAPDLHPALLLRDHRQHHVAGRDRDLDRCAGGRRDRRGGERLQQAPRMGVGGPQGGLPQGSSGGAAGNRSVGVLLAPGHRRRVHPDLRAGGSGRAAVQAAGVVQEPHHGAGRGAGHHAGSGAADDVHPHGSVPVQAEVPGQARHRRAGRHLLRRRAASRSAARSSACTSRPAGSCSGVRAR